MMKHLFFLTLLSLFVLSACQSESETDENVTDTSARLEAGFNFSDGDYSPQAFDIPAELPYGINPEESLYGKFYPIGASKSGLFAYICEPADEATGFYFFDFIIKDPASGKTLWSFSIDEKDALEGVTITNIWKEKKTLFQEKLAEYKVYPLQNKKLQNIPSTQDPIFDVNTKITYNDDKTGWGIQMVNKVKIEILQNGKSPKLLYTQSYDNDLTINVKVHGYIDLGNQNYALLETEEHIGYEGPPNVLNLNLIPFSLQK